jgi:hypothetical protein
MKQYQKKIVRTLLLSLTISFVVSCGSEPVEFNPNIFVGDYENKSLVNEYGERVFCDSPAFNHFGAFSKDQLAELANILAVAEVPAGFDPKRKELTRMIWTQVWKVKNLNR